ncbi:hypothetical protein G3495_00320 [Shewanella baltica]|uniref:hypothetical protein n=1 Tax=Shewanella baltica TaxID=62322 RepID=UPI00217DF5D8|nr:hypothetical protein [Shewanella baltica]MCS6233598.1 hypothetical protein [Shewanella baltica]MCS6268182.1 hypothetical protein [Shewanella baltica]
MITLFKFGFLFCVIIQLAMIDHTLQQCLETIRLYNESKYPLTGTETEIEKVYPLTNTDIVNGFNEKLTDSKQGIPLHNEEAK